VDAFFADQEDGAAEALFQLGVVAVVADADQVPALGEQPGVPVAVAFGGSGHSVVEPVGFDADADVGVGEVDAVCADGVLLDEVGGSDAEAVKA
jgi:hypothetical protein